MKFSIIVPVYNVEIYLSQCIESVLEQTFHDFEIILVDDGSSDKSLDICKEYAELDSRVYVISQKNGGALSARKSATEAANGDYIVCVDGDDYIHPDLLLQLNGQISMYPSIDMICYGYCEDNCGKISKPILHDMKAGKYDDVENLRYHYLYNPLLDRDNNGMMKFSLWTKCVKRDIYRECQNRVPNHIKNGEDVLCSAWILTKIQSYSVVDFSGYYYRKNDFSLTHVRVKFDLINVSNVKNELENIQSYSHENIGHYYLLAVYILLRDIAKVSWNSREFLKIADSLDFDTNYNDLRFYKRYGIKDCIRYFIVQRQKWFFLYVLVKVLKL